MLKILMFIILKLFVNDSYANYAHAYEINDGVKRRLSVSSGSLIDK